MPGRIRSARALLDIGAAVSLLLAGMLVAIPTMVIGLKLSHVGPRLHDNFVQEGQSLLDVLVKRLTLGPTRTPKTSPCTPLHCAAWGGFFVTSFNLLPFMQFDGGHVAYALLGRRHHAISRNLWWLPLTMLAYNAYYHVWLPAVVLWPRVSARVASTLAAVSTHGTFERYWEAIRQALVHLRGTTGQPP